MLTTKKKRIASGEKFEDLAKEYSDCPSGSNGGDLGTFFFKVKWFQNSIQLYLMKL